MEKYPMGNSCQRPFQTTCGMQNQNTVNRQMPGRECFHNKEYIRQPSDSLQKPFIPDSLPLAMAYIPSQKWTSTFPYAQALHNGTIFPELCQPFCGKRGIRKC